MKSSIRTIIFIWLAWVFILIGFQAWVTARLDLARPDRVFEWTEKETTATAHDGQPYLIDPFMNHQVSWDSEFYLSIATVGYADPDVRAIAIPGVSNAGCPHASCATLGLGLTGDKLSLNYAFLPFYSVMIRLVAWPLRLLGLTPIATSTLAGVIVSVVGTLAGMIALYDLAREELEDAGGIRTAFYLIAFPTGFFLAQVYTEGLFVGLAFGCLALIRRKHLVWAAVLAVLATWTRAVGAALIIPLALPWIRSGGWLDLDLEWRQIYFQGIPWKAVGKGVLSLSPLFAFLLWKFSYLGMAFGIVEQLFFGRGFMSLGVSFVTWTIGIMSLFGNNPQTAAYYLVELGAIGLGLGACWATRRRYPDLSWYGLVAILLSLTSGPAQGMHRYILAAPPVFLFLSRLGRNEAFDRAWSLISILLMGLLATMFTFDLWVG